MNWNGPIKMEKYPYLATSNYRFHPPIKDIGVSSGLHIHSWWIQSLRDDGMVRALTSSWINPLVDWKLDGLLGVEDLGLFQAIGHWMSSKDILSLVPSSPSPFSFWFPWGKQLPLTHTPTAMMFLPSQEPKSNEADPLPPNTQAKTSKLW